MMKALFGLKVDDYSNELPTFIGSEKKTPEEIWNLVTGEFWDFKGHSNKWLASMKQLALNLFLVLFTAWLQFS